MSANFPAGLFLREADKCFGICMLINPCCGAFFLDHVSILLTQCNFS
jgi:hypothetical protein